MVPSGPGHNSAKGLRPGLRPCKHAGTEAGSTRKALLRLLRPGGTLASAGAVIAYATFQMQAEQVAQFLTAHGVKAAAYHAGKHMKVCRPPHRFSGMHCRPRVAGRFFPQTPQSQGLLHRHV